jgi:hypothetical protein
MTFILDMYTENAGIRVGIIGNAKNVTHFTGLRDISSRASKKDRLLESLPNDDDLRGSIFCPAIGIKKALDALKKFRKGYRVVIVISASPETEAPFIRSSSVERQAINMGAVIYGIFIGSQQERAEDLRELCLKTEGKAFFESETVGQPYTIVNALIRVLQDMEFEGNLYTRGSLHKLHTSSFFLAHNQTWSQDVYIDKTVGMETVFYMTWNGSVEIEFTLNRPTGTILTPRDGNQFEYWPEFAVSRYKILNENGKWTMHVVNSMSTTPVAVSGLVLSRARESTAIWISTRLKYQLAKPDQAQSFTVEVKKGTRKVTGVDVTARVTSSHLPPIDIQLVKQRAGTRLGQYTAVLGSLSSNGWYNVFVTAHGYGKRPLSYLSSNRNQREAIPPDFEQWPPEYIPSADLEEFSRFQTLGMFKAIAYPDKTPPSKADVYIMNRDHTCGIVNLTWIAPGDDSNTGRASRYKVEMSNSFEAIISDSDSQLLYSVRADEVLSDSPTSLDSPKESGSEENLIFKCRICTNGTFIYISLRTVDDDNNWSKKSHPVAKNNALSCTSERPVQKTEIASVGVPTTSVVLSPSEVPTSSDAGTSATSSVPTSPSVPDPCIAIRENDGEILTETISLTIKSK